jgi:Cu2+-exporting ATPase
MAHHTVEPSLRSSIAQVKLPVSTLYCACCADGLERSLKANPHFTVAKVDFANETVTVRYHAGMLDEAAIRGLINGTGRCVCGPKGAQQETTHLHHQAQMAPITMGTKHDRMQYELPASGAQGAHEEAHKKAAGHAGMDHDMSDPKMARAMEKDMRNRFFVALVLTVPTVLYSPLGTDFLGIDLPSGVGRNWLALILSTPVVWWAAGYSLAAPIIRSADDH